MRENIYKNCILILDFGSQYTQLVARRIRELGVYCKIETWDITEEKIRKYNPYGIILSGSPKSTTQLDSPRAPYYVFKAGIPILGICYGMQIMVTQLGGQVHVSSQREFGYAKVKILKYSAIIKNIQDSIDTCGRPCLDVWMSHGDKITLIPENFVTVASTEICPFTIIADEEKKFYGVQFHPEVTHTRQGHRLIKRFVFDICQCIPLWRTDKIIDNIITDIRKKVKKDRVILGLSGGVDSLVTAVLLHRSIGDQLICIFVDNGLLRLNEAHYVMKMYSDYGLNIIHIQVADRFFSALADITDPEKKRKTIGRVFIEVFDEQAMKLTNIKWLAQGTIYPDIIESGTLVSGKVHTIKSHHNVGGLPEKMNMKLLEPLKILFKDEVRKIGLELGLSYDALYRHPFPGPGLGVRVIGKVKKEYCDLLRCADAIFIEELHKAQFYKKVSQAFTVLLPIRSVSIMGDSRKYDWVVSLRAVESIDFMTAQWSRLPYELLECVSNRIINEIKGISRVVYDISGKPPATIEWE